MKRPSAKRSQAFRRAVWDYYRAAGRGTLPWRKRTTPYRVLLSEVMLQQTEVERVVPYFYAFLRSYPSLAALARAEKPDLLRLWQGLGYNRRALYLRELARIVRAEHSGRMPRTREQLLTLPGVGEYTAAAVCVFAFNEPHPLIETNIRTAYFHHFFKQHDRVSDSELRALVDQTTVRNRPREWFYALMDYGAYLKGKYPTLHQKSAHYRKQSAFKGSVREVRGAIVRELLEQPRISRTLLKTKLHVGQTRFSKALEGLCRDGVVVEKGSYLALRQ